MIIVKVCHYIPNFAFIESACCMCLCIFAYFLYILFSSIRLYSVYMHLFVCLLRSLLLMKSTRCGHNCLKILHSIETYNNSYQPLKCTKYLFYPISITWLYTICTRMFLMFSCLYILHFYSLYVHVHVAFLTHLTDLILIWLSPFKVALGLFVLRM